MAKEIAKKVEEEEEEEEKDEEAPTEVKEPRAVASARIALEKEFEKFKSNSKKILDRVAAAYPSRGRHTEAEQKLIELKALLSPKRVSKKKTATTEEEEEG